MEALREQGIEAACIGEFMSPEYGICTDCGEAISPPTQDELFKVK